jgi:hypothetical protein
VTRKTWVLAGAAVVVAAIAAGSVVAASDAKPATSSAQDTPANTATVELGNLSDTVSQFGTLTYRARPDGSPYSVINQARGIYTELPESGDKVACGDTLYRVDDKPVLLLCGALPGYRDLHLGDVGNDVRQLNRNEHDLGYDAGVEIDPNDNRFTWKTQRALEKLQHDKGFDATGALPLDAAVFLPEPVRIATVAGELGGSAQPGAEVAQATSNTPEVQLALDPSQQDEVQVADKAWITLPSNASVTGKVDRLGTVAVIPSGQNGNAGAATIPAYLRLDDPSAALGLDQAPVRVEITTKGVASALSVPVTAIVGTSDGGFAVEVVRDGTRRELVAVKLGLFDSGGGRVQVEGDLHEGDKVVVPSS